MTRSVLILALLLCLTARSASRPASPAQNASAQASPSKPQTNPAPQKPPAAPPKQKPSIEVKPESKAPDAESELQRAIEVSGNDRAALVRNLEDYLKRFPDAPRKSAVYRALVETALQLRDYPRALEYAERFIAVQPDDSSMMLLAVQLLERLGDEHSLTKAVGYVSRVLDRVEKASPGDKSVRVSLSDWELEQKKLQMSVHLIRGRLEMNRRRYDEAVTDLEASYRILPNPIAALKLGEIAEVRKEYEKAVRHYLTAFILAEDSEATVDRADARRKLGNVWRMVHGSEAGLGEQVLAAYDKFAAQASGRAPSAHNAGVTDPYAFVLRRLDGSEMKLADAKGKVLVLNFWATWCLPCRELEPLFEQARDRFAERQEVLFLGVNTDEDEALVKPYVEREKVRVAVAFADGLDRLMSIRSVPTVIVLDRSGKIVYRVDGFAPEGFAEELVAAIARALAPAN